MSEAAASAPRRRGRPPKESIDAAGLIRRAALQSFARSGFLGTSIADIAQEAGVAKPLVHYHFASKDELWQAAVSEAFTQLRGELLSFSAEWGELALRPALQRLAHQLVAFSARHPEIVRIVVDETGKDSPRAVWLIDTFLAPMYRLAQGLIDRFQSDPPRGTPSRRPLPPADVLIPALMGMMNFAFLDARAIQQAFGTDVHSTHYQEQLGQLLFEFLDRTYLSG